MLGYMHVIGRTFSWAKNKISDTPHKIENSLEHILNLFGFVCVCVVLPPPFAPLVGVFKNIIIIIIIIIAIYIAHVAGAGAKQ